MKPMALSSTLLALVLIAAEEIAATYGNAAALCMIAVSASTALGAIIGALCRLWRKRCKV